MIEGYPERASLAPGDPVVLRVATDAAAFRVDVYRYGFGMTPVLRSGWFAGRRCPHHLPFHDWGRDGRGLSGEDLPGWGAYALPSGDDWPSGVYIAVFVEGDGAGNVTRTADAGTPDGRDSKALFVVTPSPDAAPAPALYKVPLLTYQAYNRQGGWSLYTVPDDVPAVPPCVSLRRPGGGTGGVPSDIDNFDPYDATPRQTFAHWDAPFIEWMERNGYRADYCTDLELHDRSGYDLLRRYRMMVSVGHDEYWTEAMRDHVERFVRSGGNVAFFGGNTCWWRVTFDDEWTFRRVGFWSDPEGRSRPENRLTGVSFRNGGERDRDDHPDPVGFRVQHPDHWVYAGTGLQSGETFGDGPGEYLVGYECDGAQFDRAGFERGEPVRPLGTDGTPESFVILGVGDVERSGWGFGNRAATMGLYTEHGTVFTAATTDWARLLRSPAHPVVDRITRNVLDRLGGRQRTSPPHPAGERVMASAGGGAG